MDSSHGPIADSSILIERTGIPRRVLSRVLGSTHLGVGFRVLDVGCGRGELAAYLDSLGVHCTGIDESPVNVMEARRNVPACEFNCASISDSVTGPKPGFDLVLVREASVFQTSLLSPAAFSASLQLMTRLRPGGSLAFLARIVASTWSTEGHRLACFARHVGSLPGIYELHELPDGLIFGRSIRSRTAGQHGSGYAVAVLRLPQQPLSQIQWKQAAEVAAKAAGAPCCQWAAQLAESTRFRSKAA
ncbi:MAG TPA: class I SAM-dependent methyltransferase [Planctomycetaceae bacterium]|nr:class I SAM-dependent methyltransferase [Planctomycetaceae bacterium]